APAEDGGRPPRHHQLRPEVARRGEGQARRARPATSDQGIVGARMPARPRKARRFGGDAAHQRLMMANLVASLVAAEAIITTEAKAKALRPVAEKVITKAKRADANPDSKLHQIRQVPSYRGARDVTANPLGEVG